MTTPLYDETLSDVLLAARRRVEAAELRIVELERVAERARHETDELPPRPAPAMPTMAELRVTASGSAAFFDALLGPART